MQRQCQSTAGGGGDDAQAVIASTLLDRLNVRIRQSGLPADDVPSRPSPNQTLTDGPSPTPHQPGINPQPRRDDPGRPPQSGLAQQHGVYSSIGGKKAGSAGSSCLIIGLGHGTGFWLRAPRL